MAEMKSIAIALVLGSFLVGCSGNHSTRTVEGVLAYYPRDVKSVEAWQGHTFMIEGTPILPTDAVSEEMLKKLIGSAVKVSGTWESGRRSEASADEQTPLLPTGPTNRDMLRGDGLRASSIEVVKK